MMTDTLLDFIQGADVEWKTLGEVAKVFAGGTPRTSNSEFYDGDIPWIRSGEVNFNIITNAKRNITLAGLQGSSAKMIRKNSVVMAMTGATVARTAVIEFETSANQSVAAIETDESIINYKYLYHFLAMNYQMLKSQGQGALTSLNLQMIKAISIPIPPLATQQKIVEILDKMTDYVTELTAELTAELTLRQKQYAYYRDKLLSFGAEANLLNDSEESLGVRWTTLGEVLQKTDKIKWNNVSDEKYRYIDLSSVSREFNSILETIEIDKEKHPSRAQQIVKTNDIIFGTTRPTLQRFTRINDEFDGQVASTGFVVLRPDKLKILSKFLYFSITTDRFLSYVEQNQKGASYPAISDNEVKSYKIPLPNLKAQKRIVEILDRFDKLTSDLSEGLPREIELRQKQYEYWREQLLSFNKK